MQLKNFQSKILEALSHFAVAVATHARNRGKLEEVAEASGIELPPANVGFQAWETLRVAGKLPINSPPWLERRDPIGREIYSVCLKVPTGGGKTLIGAHAVERVVTSMYGRRTGLVVWFVPSEAIYAQTLRAFTKPGHPYRVALENAAGGNLRILDKASQISHNDLDNSLCVMIIMLQATVRTESEVLKIFRDSGAFQGVFPAIDDKISNEQLYRQVPNLDLLQAEELGIPGISVRHSLANLLRYKRALFVIDEGHRAYTDLARKALNDLNPCFVLELTATPDTDGHQSNVLCSVSGVDLKSAELIKLPINVNAMIGQTWQQAVELALDIRSDLEKKALEDQKITGQYVRPIVLVRAEATGSRKLGKDDTRVHVNDVKDFLISKMKVHESWIRLKTASVNEIEDVDLMSSACPVRVILTKDALREGWDCPFAYVLVVLSSKTGKTAITQMAGRVLRQPYAKLARSDSLNESYVVCVTEDVQHSIKAVCDGLQSEGMADAAAWVKTKGAAPISRRQISRSSIFKGGFLLPVVAFKRNGAWAPFHPERDLFPLINWQAIPVPDVSKFVFSQDAKTTSVSIGLRSVSGQLAFTHSAEEVNSIHLTSEAYIPAVEAMRSVVPNSWVALDLLRAAEAKRVAGGVEPERLAHERMSFVGFLIQQMEVVVDKLLELKFQELCAAGLLKLMACEKNGIGIPLPSDIDIITQSNDQIIRRADGKALLKNLFEETYQSEVNPLELDALRYIDQSPVTTWWWRVPVRGAWGLQGWRKDTVYPDFAVLVSTDSGNVLFAIETKGTHLAGNADTRYKKALLSLLEKNYKPNIAPAIPGSPAPLIVPNAVKGMVVEQANWRTELAGVLRSPSG